MYIGAFMRFLILLALLAQPAFAAERRYSVSDFDEVRVIGAHRVSIAIARATSVTASGPQAALDALSVETQGRSLVIQSRAQTMAGATVPDRGAATLTLTVPVLKTVRLQGTGSVAVTQMRGAQAEIALTGSGAIAVAALRADKANVRLSGAGRIELAGAVKDLAADIKGPGELAADKLQAADLKLTSATTGRATLSATRSAAVTATGPGEVTILGKPACTVTNNGTGTVNCGGK